MNGQQPQYNQHHHQHQQQQQYYADVGAPETGQALTTDYPTEATEEMDPNLVGPWGQVQDHSQTHHIQQEQHHQQERPQPHHHTHSHSFEPHGFHQIQLAQPHSQQEQPRPSIQSFNQRPVTGTEDDRAALVAHPGGQGYQSPALASSDYRPSHLRNNSSHASIDLDSQKAFLRQQRQSRMGLNSGSDGLGKSKDMHRDLSDFDIANGRSGKDLLKSKGLLTQHGAEIPISWGHLFKRPLIRQWLHNGKLYREEDEREPSRFELFFDLSFVGIIHLLADGAAESATAINVAKFVLTFAPAWSIWLDVRGFINISGTDDVWQRIYILLMMILLAGYAANATGIKIENFGLAAHAAQLAELMGEGGEGGAGAGGEGGTSVAEGLLGGEGGGGGGGGGHGEASAGEHARRLLVNHVGPWLLKRSEAASAGAAEEEVPPLSHYLANGYYFLEGYEHALRSAIIFFLVAKCIRLLLFLIYGALLPKFRKALWLNGLALTLIAAVSIPLTFVSSPELIIILWTAGIAVDVFSRYFIALGLQLMHARQKHRGETSFIPAGSIEHIMERMVLFTILIIGEAILVSNYTAQTGTFGLSYEFGRSALAVTLAFLICWLFFDADAARTFVHALRRNWFTSISFTTLHLPLCASLVLMASAMHKLVAEDEVEQGYLWYFSGSLSVTILCIAGIGILHHSLDKYKSALMPHHMRIFWRLVASALIASLPMLKDEWRSLPFLGTHVAILAWLVAFETIGKIGAVGKRYDEERANELKARRAMLHAQGERSGDNSFGSNGSFGMDRLAEKGAGSGATTTARSPNVLEPGLDEENSSRRDRLFYRMRRLNKDWTVRAPRRASWHEYEDLTGAERGEEDVGIESELGKLEVKEVSSGQRWAYAV
ncbi:unnamed protein product [Tilletia controversa]|uniref:Uncharacterized protein n=1 Tax=Tilletia controversa TaxID=13291 RepID=A0A8X7MMT9_9BASI|nr:hypothetical protein CF328_g6099 [Tilletia controversa]KAE8242335.1 hypothetical protein A4X06_0g7001 [Tilletia controversa]CAD6920460.1 unnamed protein product [Tilletia controversa]CAD6931717.1 unnamed protein product [Tilletia controversa]CAD6970470.1 unnamed protein product [Tilletia controversa]